MLNCSQRFKCIHSFDFQFICIQIIITSDGVEFYDFKFWTTSIWVGIHIPGNLRCPNCRWNFRHIDQIIIQNWSSRMQKTMQNRFDDISRKCGNDRVIFTLILSKDPQSHSKWQLESHSSLNYDAKKNHSDSSWFNFS